MGQSNARLPPILLCGTPGCLTLSKAQNISDGKILRHFKILHLKLRNINTLNVTHSLISRNSRELTFVVQISLLIVMFLFLISQNLSLLKNTKEVNPHPCIAPCVNMWSVLFFFYYLLSIGACIRHIAHEGQVEWTTVA